MADFDNNAAYMKYLGLASLLGRIAGRVRQNNEDREILARAFADVNEVMASRNSEQVFKKTHDDGYSLFEKG